jgi:ATP-dependent Clp protease ATP-binding subunit ClpC
MFERFTERARQVVVLAQEEARTLKHNYIGTEHVLLGLLREEEGLACRVLESFDVTVERVRSDVVRIVGSGEETHSGQIPFTPRAKKIFELALREAISLGHNYIGTEHILLGLVREMEGVGMRILMDQMADPGETSGQIAEKIRNEVIRMLSGPGGRRHVDESQRTASEHTKLQEDIDKATREKEEALQGGRFEEAGRLRDTERVLRSRLAELVGHMRDIASHWTVEVTYRAPGGHLETKQVGEWPRKPGNESDANAYIFAAKVNSYEEPTIIIPTAGAVSIEIKQVTTNG